MPFSFSSGRTFHYHHVYFTYCPEVAETDDLVMGMTVDDVVSVSLEPEVACCVATRAETNRPVLIMIIIPLKKRNFLSCDTGYRRPGLLTLDC